MSAIRSDYGRGIGWSFLSALLWSTTFLSARFLLRQQAVDPITLALLRFAIGGLVLLVCGQALFRRGIWSFRLRDHLQAAFLGACGIMAMSVLLFIGQQGTTAINASLIMQLSPVLILLGGLGLGIRVTLRQASGILISLAGCVLIVDLITIQGVNYRPDHLAGDALVLLSAGCWTVYTILGQPFVRRVGGFHATTWAMLWGALELVALRLVAPLPCIWPSDGTTWSLVFYLAIFPTALAFLAWYEAMQYIELALLNVMQYLTPVFTLVLGWFLLGERLSWLNGAGIALVLAGVILTNRKTRGKATAG
jgi:drug/metabolite transporter (DMT)-like permease